MLFNNAFIHQWEQYGGSKLSLHPFQIMRRHLPDIGPSWNSESLIPAVLRDTPSVYTRRELAPANRKGLLPISCLVGGAGGDACLPQVSLDWGPGPKSLPQVGEGPSYLPNLLHLLGSSASLKGASQRLGWMEITIPPESDSKCWA